jgi:hypothetical protein
MLTDAFSKVHEAVKAAREVADAHDEIELYEVVDQFESKCMAAVSQLRVDLKLFEWK